MGERDKPTSNHKACLDAVEAEGAYKTEQRDQYPEECYSVRNELPLYQPQSSQFHSLIVYTLVTQPTAHALNISCGIPFMVQALLQVLVMPVVSKTEETPLLCNFHSCGYGTGGVTKQTDTWRRSFQRVASVMKKIKCVTKLKVTRWEQLFINSASFYFWFPRKK